MAPWKFSIKRFSYHLGFIDWEILFHPFLLSSEYNIPEDSSLVSTILSL